jgi:endothelin-converting enzyme/putative endopeptidase
VGSLDLSAIDKSADPCQDFYQYACGNWVKRTEIPADRSSWGRSFSVIDEENQNVLKASLEEAAATKTPDAMTKQLGDFYAACMDEGKIEKDAKIEVDDQLKHLDGVKDMNSLAKEVAREHLGLGAPLFTFGQQQDFKDSSLVIGSADQGGLGLPDRDYYLSDDDKAKALRAAYVEHVAKILALSGIAPEAAKAQAQIVLKIETDLAKASMSRVDRRQPEKLNHRIELKGLQKLMPRFPWALYLKEIGVPGLTQINVIAPDFFSALGKMLSRTIMPEWRIYLRWHILHAAAPLLSKAFVDENFAFYDKTLAGAQQILPRWKRCVTATDHMLGEELGQLFVKKTFGEEGKTVTKTMIQSIEKAMADNLAKLSWMDEPTRKAAMTKLAAITNKIGFPDVWRDYSTVKITRDSFLGNVEAAANFEAHRELNKIGKPVDHNEWEMSPPTVNAYYEPSRNEMVFPAGILQAPFYSKKAADAVNYGAIGMVMGHELTHGFDDEGRKFDGKGNLTNWWSKATNEEFEKRAQCVIDEYNGFEVLPGKHINGKLTTGENLADLGGIKLAYTAYEAARAAKGKPEPRPAGSFTDDQLFFLGTAQAWCSKRRPELEAQRLITDPHSTPKYRIQGPLSNIPEFAAAFQCKPGSKMVRQNACVVW